MNFICVIQFLLKRIINTFMIAGNITKVSPLYSASSGCRVFTNALSGGQPSISVFAGYLQGGLRRSKCQAWCTGQPLLWAACCSAGQRSPTVISGKYKFPVSFQALTFYYSIVVIVDNQDHQKHSTKKRVWSYQK